MKQRKEEYMKTVWTKDDWDEELTVYKDRLSPPSPYEICLYMKKVKLTISNALIVAPFLLRLQEYQKYDFKRYMKRHWMEKMVDK